MAIRPARWGDLETAAGLLGVQNRAAVGAAGVRREHLRSEWEAASFALGKDNFVAEEAGRVVGYAAVSTSGELTLAAPGEQLADELLGRVASRARVRGDRILAVTVPSRDSPLRGLAERHPFELEHETLLMWRRLGEPVEQRIVPDKVTIRTFRLEDAEAVHGLLDEAFARRGERRVGLKVDAGNPTGAVQLYERLGFFIERREAVWAWSL